MFNAWNTLSTELEKVLPESNASKVHIQIAMLDSGWKDFPSIKPCMGRSSRYCMSSNRELSR
jgi:hypothetical protein